MEADLVCTTCHEPLDESSSPLAQQMKVVIRQKIAAGWTKKQIENYFVVTEGFGPRCSPCRARTGSTCSPGSCRSRRSSSARWPSASAPAPGSGTATTPAHPSEERMAPALERRVDQELAGFDT